MASEELDKLIVEIESNVADLVNEVNKGVKETTSSLEDFEKSGSKAFKGTEKGATGFGEALKGAGSKALSVVKIIKTLALAVTAVTIVFKLFPGLAKKVGERLGFIGVKGKAAIASLRPLVRTVDNVSNVLGIAGAATAFVTTLLAIAAAAVAVASALGLIVGVKIVSFFKSFSSAAVVANQQFEVFASQFETLLGSATAARERLDELARFGVETPFELPEVVEASRILQVFGGAALATGENLRMIGDIAAGVNRPFTEVAFWTGRMFDALQSGRPFGEAAARLQEMGALSGVARAQLEKLQKEGATGQELWAAFNEQVGTKFEGNMERLSKTLAGIRSNLTDFRENLIRIGGAPVFETVRDAAERFLNLISDPARTKVLERMTTLLAEIASIFIDLALDPLIEGLDNLDSKSLDTLGDALEDAVAALNELLDLELEANFTGIIQAVTVFLDAFTVLTNVANRAQGIWSLIGPIFNGIREAIFTLVAPVFNLIEGFKQLTGILEDISGQDLTDFSRNLADATETEAQRRARLMKQYRDAFEGQTPGRPTTGATPDTSLINPDATEEGADRVTEIIESLSDEFLNLQDTTNAELEANEADHLETMASLQQDFLTDTAEATEAAGKKLLDFEDDIRKARETIFNDARESLAELSRETDQQIAREREKGNLEEARATEDHLRDMRRLRLSFLDDLEGAVASRDAGRVRDLQRQFARESQERTEDFQTEQGREGQDRSSRLAQIRASEQEQSAAILSEQNKRLEALRVLETERRAELQENLRMELEQIRLKSEETIRKEQEEHTARQAELNRALAERLSSLATELAAENDITAEGARAILSTYNNFFGIGGDVDKLMEEFSQRQRDRMRLSLQLPRNVGARGGGGSSRSRSPIGQVQAFAEGGSMIARKPTLALFGERTPEMAQFTPLNKMGGGRPQQMQIEFSGSAPPGIRGGEIEQIAAIINRAFREAGA